MGCRESRGSISEQETLVTKHEDEQGIQGVFAKDAVLHLKKYSHDHKFSKI